MLLGIPKEVKDQEFRVALLPNQVGRLIRLGHRVLVEKDAGAAIGFSDQDYRLSGAQILRDARTLYQKSELVVKVKEPQPSEYPYLRKGLKLFCFLHLAANPKLEALLRVRQVAFFPFEDVTDSAGLRPILRPMSEIAGKLSVLLGSQYLQLGGGGKGVLLSPTQDSEPGKVLILGAGSVGRAAAELADGMGAEVRLLDRQIEPLAAWRERFPKVRVQKMTPRVLTRHLSATDLLVGAVYVPGEKTPRLLRESHFKAMRPGSVFVDVAVDQGGCSETTRPTSISRPTYVRSGVVHCAIPNMPALVSHSASLALAGALFPHLLKLIRRES